MQISREELARISAAIPKLVNKFGHPDEIPIGSLASEGVEPHVAELCEMLVTQEDYPADVAQAVAKWMRQIGELVD